MACRSPKPRRCKRPVCYKELSETSVPLKKVQTEKWSTRKLYELEILETKEEIGKVYAKVHYLGWPSNYDEFRPINDIIPISDVHVKTSKDILNFFFEHLRISVQESLHVQRLADSIVELKIPVSRGTFEEFASLGKPQFFKNRKCYMISSHKDLEGVLGQGWNYRVANPAQDFAFVEISSLRFYLAERAPLMSYLPSGESQNIHRGFMCVIKFIRGLGSRDDLPGFLQELNI